MSFLDTIKHLLPTGRAWRLTIEKTLRRFFEGLAAGAPVSAREFIDDVHDDLYPDRTRELARWETQFALVPGVTEADRRAQIDGSWKATGGQDPRYLQDVVQAAGFPLYVHEWWSSGPDPYVPRDPRAHTFDPLIGTMQCGEPLAQCGEIFARANGWLANDPRYLVNKNLTLRPPPHVPADPLTWPYFIYFGGETFGDVVDIPAPRRAELETLLLRICPTQHWIVLMARWVEYSAVRVTLQDDDRVTLQGDVRVTLGL